MVFKIRAIMLLCRNELLKGSVIAALAITLEVGSRMAIVEGYRLVRMSKFGYL